jgi:hypothetical protein
MDVARVVNIGHVSNEANTWLLRQQPMKERATSIEIIVQWVDRQEGFR